MGSPMSSNKQLSKLRLELDDAITYGRPAQALKIAGEGLKKAKGQGLIAEAEYFKGQIELINEDFPAAIKHFDAAIQHNPADGAAYNDRALCMVELGIIDQALEYFQRGIEAEPDFATIHHNKGWLLNNIGRHSEAIACFKKALSLDPRRPVTYDNLADALFNLGDYPGARDAYQKALELLGPGRCADIAGEIRKRIKSIEEIIS